jgi:hypothetical protein
MCANCSTVPERFESLLTPAAAGAYLGVHPKTAIRMAREGDIPPPCVSVESIGGFVVATLPPGRPPR